MREATYIPSVNDEPSSIIENALLSLSNKDFKINVIRNNGKQ